MLHKDSFPDTTLPVESMHRAAYHAARSRMRGRDPFDAAIDPDDIAQIAILKVLVSKRRAGIDGSPDAFATTVAVNTIRSFSQRSRTRVAHEEIPDEYSSEHPGNVDSVTDKVDAEELVCLLSDTVSRQDRLQLVLDQSFLGASHAELAAMHDIPTGTVMSRLTRGKADARVALAGTSWDPNAE